MNTLQPLNNRFLLPKEIKPRGWLARQLRIQADGLSGHLDEFWPDVWDSRWFGGNADAWERAPYWLDGFIPLAFLLKDEQLIAKADRYIAKILELQSPEGWLGPMEGDQQGGFRYVHPSYDLWAEILIFKVLVEYHRATGDGKVFEALVRGLRYFYQLIETHPLANWGSFRWFEGLIAIYYVYDHQPEDWLLDLAVCIQAQGFDWVSFFERWPLQEPTAAKRWTYMGHVVNNAMAVKAGALWARLSGAERDRAGSTMMLDMLERHHGQVSGVFTGDECLAGRNPLQGTELCAVNELAYSLEWLNALSGKVRFADQLEKVVFNALPATFSPDMWTHQYDQQVNQAKCSVHPRRWNTNGPESNLFGLEPNYGCCTANLSQGWPKFAASLWMRAKDGGFTCFSYSPCEVTAECAAGEIHITNESEYPFRDIIKLRIATKGTATIPIHLRIPAWAVSPKLFVGGAEISVTANTFVTVERNWSEGIEIILELPSQVETYKGGGGGVSLVRGPLVYALPIADKWIQIHQDVPGHEFPHCDYEVHPRSAWNYALVLDSTQPEKCVSVHKEEPGESIFSPQGAPCALEVPARKVANWELVDETAGDIPTSFISDGAEIEKIRLIPYGCTNLRISEFPVINPLSVHS